MSSEIRAAKRRRTGVAPNPFIDIEAYVDEEDEYEEDEEGDEDEDEEDDDENEEDAARVLAVDNGDGSQCRHRIERPYDAAEDLRAQAERLASRYQAAIVPEDALESGGSDFKERIASYPTVDDCGIWRVFVNPGQEADLVERCFENLTRSPRPRIFSIFERSTIIPGCIYVEASSQADVSNLVTGIYGIYSRDFECVALEERPTLLSLRSPTVEEGSWVRFSGRGRYRNDLGNVVDVDHNAQTATVWLVPRVSLEQADRKRKDAKGKGKRRVRPSQQIFHPEQSGQHFERLDDAQVEFRGHVFVGGLIALTFPIDKLRPAFPSLPELEVFGRTSVLNASMMLRTLSESAAATLAPGNRVRVIKGEQTGLTGEITDIVDNVITLASEAQAESPIDVPLTSVRAHFRRGDYVLVKIGKDAGKFGCVIVVEQTAETDWVTFIEDASIKAGSPEQITLAAFFLKIYDLPIDSVSFPHGQLEAQKDLKRSIQVIVVGNHPSSGQYGVVRDVGKFTRDGRWESAIVEFNNGSRREDVPLLNLRYEFLKPGDYVRVLYRTDYDCVYTVKAIDDTQATLVTVVPGDPLGVGHEFMIPRMYIWPCEERQHPWLMAPRSISKHPAVGLRVTVSGAHPLSGYHGIIRETLDVDATLLSVELEAKMQRTTIEKKNLMLRQGEARTTQATAFFQEIVESWKYVAPTVLPTSEPLTPSTPLPPQVVFGSVSPAWDPSSRTPGRMSSLEESPSTSSRPPKNIKKPQGMHDRSRGYSLKQILGWDDNTYSEIEGYIKNLISQHFDASLSMTKQSDKAMATVFSEIKAKKKYPILHDYHRDWALKGFITKFLKTSTQREGRHRG